MDRTDKSEFISDVREAFLGSSLVILTDFKGSSPSQMDAIRRAAEKAGGHFKVVKNTLARRAVADTPFEKLSSLFRGNIGVVFSGDDPVATAKMYREIKKANGKLEPRAGFFEGDVLDARAVDAVADLPSREQLLSTLLATIQEGPRQVLGVIQGPARDLLYVLNNYAAKLEEGE